MKLYFVGRGGSSWRDPRNWARTSDGPSFRHLHATGKHSLVVSGEGPLDLRGMPHAGLEIDKFSGKLRMPDGQTINFVDNRPTWRRLLANNINVRVPGWLSDKLAAEGRSWPGAVRAGTCKAVLVGAALVVIPLIGGGASAWFWVGGAATWDDATTTHWATTTGGAGGAGVPVAGDSVTFDANSGLNGATVTYSSATNPSFGNVTLNASGSTLSLGATFNIATASTLNIAQGTFTTNGSTLNVGIFSSGGALARTINLGASAVNVNTAGASAWQMNMTTNLTFNAGTSTITFVGTGSNISYGTSAGSNTGTFYNVIWNSPGGGSTFSANAGGGGAGTLTFNNLTLNGGTNKAEAVEIIAHWVVNGTFTAAGNSTINRLWVRSNTWLTPRTVQAAATSLTNVSFSDVTASGAAAWSGTSVGDLGGNSGITFTPAVTRYCIGGNYSATTTWSATSGGVTGASAPLPQDTAIMDGVSTTTGLTVDMPFVSTITATSNLRSLVLSGSSFSQQYFGDNNGFDFVGGLTLATGQTFTSNGNTIVFMGPGSYSIDTKGINLNLIDVNIEGRGTYTLGSDFVVATGAGTRNFTHTSGGFNGNGFNLQTATLSSTGSLTRSFTGGSGTITLLARSNGNVVQFSGSNCTLDVSTTSFVMSELQGTGTTNTMDYEFAGTLTAASWTHTKAGASCNVAWAGAWQFTNSFTETCTSARTVQLPASKIITAANVTLSGASGQLLTFQSSSSGTSAKLKLSAGGTSSINNFVTNTTDVTLPVSGTDSGSSTASGTLAARPTSADTASGSSTTTLRATATSAETGSGVSTSTLAARGLSSNDTGAETDSGSLHTSTTSADAASGSNAGSVGSAQISHEDSAHSVDENLTDYGAETGSMSSSDSGSGDDECELLVSVGAGDVNLSSLDTQVRGFKLHDVHKRKGLLSGRIG